MSIVMKGQARDADEARRNGWLPGTELRGVDGYGPSGMVITALGDHMILGRRLPDGRESSWTLAARTWEVVKPPAPEDGKIQWGIQYGDGVVDGPMSEMQADGVIAHALQMIEEGEYDPGDYLPITKVRRRHVPAINTEWEPAD